MHARPHCRRAQDRSGALACR